MISINVLAVTPTLLIGDSNIATARMSNERADYDCGVWTRLSPVSVSLNASIGGILQHDRNATDHITRSLPIFSYYC